MGNKVSDSGVLKTFLFICMVTDSLGKTSFVFLKKKKDNGLKLLKIENSLSFSVQFVYCHVLYF